MNGKGKVSKSRQTTFICSSSFTFLNCSRFCESHFGNVFQLFLFLSSIKLILNHLIDSFVTKIPNSRWEILSTAFESLIQFAEVTKSVKVMTIYTRMRRERETWCSLKLRWNIITVLVDWAYLTVELQQILRIMRILMRKHGRKDIR